jgi:hypothetical protein
VLPIEMLDRNQLEFLSARHDQSCISMFMPTHRAGPETRQDPIRLKNLAREAESRIIASGVRPVNAKQILSPVRNLLRQAGFWRAQADGLALFASQGFFQYFRLPLQVEELVTVKDCFQVSPLVPVFTMGGQFYLLALSRNKVRFFLGAAYTLREVELKGVPGNIAEALRYDVREAQAQFHSAEPGGIGGPLGKKGSVYHGQGVGVDDEQARTLEYLLIIERGVRHRLRNQQLPLVLAGVTELLSVYRSINKYPRLLDNAVSGNTDGWGEDELHAHAWRIVQPYHEQARKQALSEYKELLATGRTSNDLKEILLAAYQGRVQAAFLGCGAHQWGNYNFEEDTLEIRGQNDAGSEDLFNLVAIQTILHDGAVYALPQNEMPNGSSIAAVFRY